MIVPRSALSLKTILLRAFPFYEDRFSPCQKATWTSGIDNRQDLGEVLPFLLWEKWWLMVYLAISWRKNDVLIVISPLMWWTALVTGIQRSKPWLRGGLDDKAGVVYCENTSNRNILLSSVCPWAWSNFKEGRGEIFPWLHWEQDQYFSLCRPLNFFCILQDFLPHPTFPLLEVAHKNKFWNTSAKKS